MKKKHYKKPEMRAIGIRAESCLLTASGVTDEQINRKQFEDKELSDCHAEHMDVNPTPVSNVINGHECVDLGLSVKWATCNVGASSPTAYGDYFAWGETATKAEYTGANSATNNKTIDQLKSAGYVDDNNLTANYDAAAKNWGGTWRTPTLADYRELIDKCTWTWKDVGHTDCNGVTGYEVKGPNGHSIFLPAGGFRYDSGLDSAGDNGFYWSATSDVEEGASFTLYFFNPYGRQVYSATRRYGFSVRPVSK